MSNAEAANYEIVIRGRLGRAMTRWFQNLEVRASGPDETYLVGRFEDQAALQGFLVLPWTTLMYLLIAPGGVEGFDYLFIALAVLLDVASLSGGGVYGRRRGRQPAMS